LMLIGISEATKKYKITVTKSGYETVETLPPYPTTAYNPVHEYASVIAGAVNPADIYQNQLSDLLLETKNYLGNSVPGINFHLTGGRKLGLNPNSTPPNNPVYSTDADYVTGSDGKKYFGSTNPGLYTFILKKPGYKLIGINPVSPASLIPGQSMTLNVKVSPENVTALLVTVKESANGNPMPGASVHLTNASGYDVTLATGDDGMAFFPNTETPPFNSGTYSLAVTSSGYDNYSEQVSVNSNELKEATVLLEAQ
jgi:hypothetical protein